MIPFHPMGFDPLVADAMPAMRSYTESPMVKLVKLSTRAVQLLVLTDVPRRMMQRFSAQDLICLPA